MIPKYLPAIWGAVAPALGNHLWQSTLFAVGAGLLTLILRKNHARARYCLWLAASVKFLIPFSLLVGIGTHLALSRGSAASKAGLYFAMEEANQLFAQATMTVISQPTSSRFPPSLSHVLPTILAAVWLCGFAVVLFVWYVRWRRISTAIREAVPLREGREVEALRRLERIGGIRKRIEIFLSRASLEPGIFGIARTVLVWPEGISERLEDAQLDAILAHEVWHVRRCDNLAAATHMAVQAIFWFHPLVWWLGARLVEERERACDEEVLELRGERQIYAESILKVCEFCVGSPLACVSGVAGADLKKRIVRIMTGHVALKLDVGRKLLLSAAGLAAVAMPVVFGLLHAAQSPTASQAQAAQAEAKSVEGHPPAPQFTLTGISREKLSLADYKGKVVMLDFWATWCGPCRIQIPGFVELQNRYRDQGFAIIGISMDDDPEVVEEFYRQFELNYPVALGTAKLSELYGGILGMPTTFLIGRDGLIHAKHVGTMDIGVFEQEIETLLDSPAGEEVTKFGPADRTDEIELGNPAEANCEIPGVHMSGPNAAELDRFKKQLEGSQCTRGLKLNVLRCHRRIAPAA